jgi:dipeptidyl-peptidase-4
VTDLYCYDRIYQERYVGLPQEIRRRIDNTEALVNTLVKAHKPFTMMAYPNRTHCICEGYGTTLHVNSLLTRYLREHMPAGSLRG